MSRLSIFSLRQLLLFVVGILCLLPTRPLLAEDAFAEADRLRLTGRYAEAEESYVRLEATRREQSRAGRAACRVATGRLGEADQLLSDAAMAAPKNARYPALRAVLAFERGDYATAKTLADEALKRDASSLPALWVWAELQRVAGRIDAAKSGYEKIVAEHRTPKQKHFDDPDDLRWIGLAAAQLARWNRDHDQFRFLVNDLYPDALRLNKNYWPAHLEAALLFAEKYNASDATAELNAALAINPNAAEIHVARAALALLTFDFETARAALDRALAINDKYLPARHLQADLLFAEIRPHAALTLLEKARELNPMDEETLGRLAAAYGAVDGGTDRPAGSRMGKLIDEVQQQNPNCGSFFSALAASFDHLRKYPQAAQYYEVARQRMPQLIHVDGELGMMQMRLGNEVEGAKLLTAAFASDPFNVRVKNQLEVLDVLQNYAVLETEHFVIRFDRGQDELLAKFAAKHLEEEVYPEITQQLGFEPPEKSLFEIFSRAKNTSGHSWFSARMVGLPFIGTVGACAGKVVALTSPNDLPKKFDWARVLRHEFVHVVNLQQTNFNIPHWFTEALAVTNEGGERPLTWNRLLARRLRAGQLFDLQTINHGFARPKSGDDWTLAYCQAAMYADYMQQTFGAEATTKMLSAYAANATTVEALQRSFDVEVADFETGYHKFLEAHVAKIVLESSPEELKPEELEAAQQKDPTNPVKLAQLAFAALQQGQNQRARRYADDCRQRDAKNQLAAYVLAKLRLSIGDRDEALETLEQAFDEARPNEHLLWLLATLKLQDDDRDRAVKLLQLGAKNFSQADRWLKALTRIFLETNDLPALRKNLTELAKLDGENSTYAKKLAQLAFDAEDWPAAERWSKRVLHLEIGDSAAHAWLAEALAQQGRHAAALDHFAAAVQLDPNELTRRRAWAKSLVVLKKRDEAQQVLKDLLKREPDDEAAQKLLETLSP